MDDKTVALELLLNVRIAVQEGLENPESATDLIWRICSLCDEWRADRLDRQLYE